MSDPEKLPKLSIPDWAVTQVIKPSDASSLQLGTWAAAIDGEILAAGSLLLQKVFVYNISINPAQEILILTSPDSTGSDSFGISVAVSREYGILVGAHGHDIGGTLYEKWILLLYNRYTLPFPHELQCKARAKKHTY